MNSSATDAPVLVGPDLSAVKVTSLLGSFDHVISFPVEWEFVILFGPNGVGKTRFLELIRAAASLDQELLISTQFDLLTFSFSDSSRLQFEKIDRSVQPSLLGASDPSDGVTVDQTICLVSLRDATGEVTQLELAPSWESGFEEWLYAYTSWRRYRNAWRDTSDGEMSTLSELAARYRGVFPTGSATRRAVRRQKDAATAVPQAISDFLSRISVHLIETQRLLIERRSDPDPWADQTRPEFGRTVTQYSNDLKNQLDQTLAAHSRLSQQLDRTFPRRVIGTRDKDESESAIRERYQQQNSVRSRLAEFSLIDRQDEIALPTERLEQFEIKALGIYLDDTERKLGVFTSLLSKLELFKQIMNSRLIRKTVTIDVREGLVVRRGSDGPVIPSESLSSGEQHELVLFYDLLFRTQPGSLVLIDEPEISLHVAWQKEFLADIVSVARLSALRFVIATHSPQIIDTWWARTNELTAQ